MKRRKAEGRMRNGNDALSVVAPDDLKAIKTAILKSRYMAARLANAEMLKLYCSIGAFVSRNSRDGKWGTGAIDYLSAWLSKELPGIRGFSAANIKNMRIFAEQWVGDGIRQPAADKLTEGCRTAFGDLAKLEIRQPVADEFGPTEQGAFLSIGFSHHMMIIFACKSLEERMFYILRCAKNFWSKRELQRHLAAHEYEVEGKIVNNFALRLPDEKQVGRAVQAFRSEYLLDFVNIVDLNETEEERDEPEWMMEMVSKIRHFIHALGSDFCFMDVKKRFVVGEEEFFSDLVFYHRALKCMVAIELKRGKFKPAYLGQLDFYLACLDKYEKRTGENPSIGLLLCREMDRTVVELAVRRYQAPLGVATYRTSADVPEEYKSLRPLMDGARELLDREVAEGVIAGDNRERTVDADNRNIRNRYTACIESDIGHEGVRRLKAETNARKKLINATFDATETAKAKYLAVFDLICKNNETTFNAISNATGISKRSVATYVAFMASIGILRRVGPDKGGHWEVGLTAEENAEDGK